MIPPPEPGVLERIAGLLRESLGCLYTDRERVRQLVQRALTIAESGGRQ
jgi:hypothetical protein